MTPIFFSITSTGQIWASCDPAFKPAGTIVKDFRVSSLPTNQKVCTLTGSGNASSSALGATVNTKSGKGEGNEIT